MGHSACSLEAWAAPAAAAAATPATPALPEAHWGARPSPAPVRAAAPLRSCLLSPGAHARGGGQRGGRRGAREPGARGSGAGQRAGLGANFCGLEAGALRWTGGGEVSRDRGAAAAAAFLELSAPWHLLALGPTLPARPMPRPRPGRGAAGPPTSRSARASPPTVPRCSRGAGRPAPLRPTASLGCGRRHSQLRVRCCGLLPRRPLGSRP